MRQNKVGEQNYFRLFGHFSIALVLLGTTAFGESFSEFKSQQTKAYQKYRDERDNAFAGYLKEQWKAYQKYVSASLYEKPKPKIIPKAKPKPVVPKGPKVYIKVKPLPKKDDFVVQKDRKKTDPSELANKEAMKEQLRELQKKKQQVVVAPKPVEVKKDIEFDFFGAKVGFDIPDGIKKAKFYPTNQQGITNYFNAVASSEYDVLLDEIKDTKEKLRLNDWGLYLLVEKLGTKIYPYVDEARLFEWFVFNKLGYKVKVALANNRVITMFYSKKIIYSTPNFRFNKERYYVLSHYNKRGLGVVYSYPKNYPGAKKSFDLSLKEIPNLPADYKEKTTHFTFEHKRYDVSYKYNKNLIDFFATYPQADYKSFFNAAVDDVTYESLATSLKRYINGKRASEAMNLVLAFVQKGFKYQTDQQQFGREKVMFVEETLHYPACDCEDRAILYSFLVKRLFEVPVLGIKYPNHMATALYIPLSGDSIKIKGRRFVVADPTYINAQIGRAMPQFRGKLPKEFILVTLK